MADSFKQIVKIRPKGGIVTDITPGELDDNFYSRGQNVTFRSGSAQRCDGYAQVFDASPVEPWHITFALVGNSFYWIVCGQSEVWVWDSVAWNDITPVGLSPATVPNDWTSTTLNGIPCFNNGVSVPFYWGLNPGVVCEPLPGWSPTDRCKALRAFKYHLFALNMTRDGVEYPDLLLWSDAAEPGAVPGTWTPAADNQAGDTILAEAVGPIIDAAPLRGQLAIYKANSTHLAQFIGGQFVFSFRKMFNVGVIARDCIVPWRNQHLFITSGDVMITDGTNINSCIDNRVRDFFFNTLNSDTYANTFAVHNPFHNEVLIVYPTQASTANDNCLTFDYVENTWGIRSVPGVWAASEGFIPGSTDSWESSAGSWNASNSAWEQAVFNPSKLQVVFGGEESILYGLDTSGSAAQEPIEAYVIKDAMHFGEPDMRKLVKRVYPKFRGQAGGTVWVSMYGSDQPGQAPTWGAESEYDIQSDSWITSFVSGKYISVRVRSTGTQVWRLDGFDLDVSAQGAF